MRCLVCKTVELQEEFLENDLKVHSCSECGGKWMRFGDYFAWHTTHKHELENALEINSLPAQDSVTAKLCPDCETLLTAYKVSSKLDFRLEHCNSCNGIWFDKNEWEAIKRENLHHQIHNFFTEGWQKKIREEERRDFFEKHYIKRFGAEDYQRLKQVKLWIDDSENKSSMLAYLMNKDPYKL